MASSSFEAARWGARATGLACERAIRDTSAEGDATADELTPSQAAARVGATTRTVQRWIAAGRLPARRVGGRWRVASDALDAFVAPSTSAAAGPALAVAVAVGARID